MGASRIRKPGHPDHGTHKEACSSCRHLDRKLGIEEVKPEAPPPESKK
jgi:hypothetical protein